MESPKNSPTLEDINEEDIRTEQPTEEETNGRPPQTIDSSQRLHPSLKSQSRCSTSSLRLDALACSQSLCLQENLKLFGNLLNDRNVKSLKKQLHDQELIRGPTGSVHLKKCTHTPTPRPPSGRRSPPSTQQYQDQRIQRFNAMLKRKAFDRLTDKIFTKLPHLLLQTSITDLSQLAATTQHKINVIFTIIRSYVGDPLTIHDHELYQHLSVWLARFIEDVISSVQWKIYSDESIIPKEEEQRQQRNRGRCSMTTVLLEDLPEAKILRSSIF
ncbi:uncharacterized protein LOC135701238 [Ochlerotatus camptorhynchus]|uniref:uncharacterized protein LOC135701238 n=1 Tax=Ochlerotatus camptorhynchus TaxID=644619 RepID=UPI0031D644B1